LGHVEENGKGERAAGGRLIKGEEGRGKRGEAPDG